MELTQIRILIDDFPRSFRFYRDVLGLTPQHDDERGPYAKFTAAAGSCAIALQSRAHFCESFPQLLSPGGDRALIVLRVAALRELAYAITARGGTFCKEPHEAWRGMWNAYLRDPEGNLVELQEWPA